MNRNKVNVFDRNQVRVIAQKYGYEEIKVKPSDQCYKVKMIFRHPRKRGCGGSAEEFGPARITVILSTGNVTTYLDHPRAGKGQLFRKADARMLERVFDNPRVHSNVGYKEKPETRKRHREQGFNPFGIEHMARGFGVVQTKRDNILLEYGDHQNVRLRIWFKTGTIGLTYLGTEIKSEVYLKNATVETVKKVFQNPKQVLVGQLEQERDRQQPDRPPLAPIQPSSANNAQISNSLVGDLDSASVKAIAEEWDYTFKENSAKLYQLQLEKAPGRGKVTVNIYRQNSTVMVQKQPKPTTHKKCNVANLETLLQLHHQKTPFLLVNNDDTMDSSTSSSSSEGSLLQQELKKISNMTKNIMNR